MAWPGKAKITADELSDEVKEQLRKLDKLDTAVTKDDLTVALAPVEEMKTGLAAVQAAIEKLTVKPANTNTEEPQSAEDITIAMLADPQKFLAERDRPMIAAQLDTAARLSELSARQDPAHAGFFQEYGPEFLTWCDKNTTVQQRAAKGFYDYAIRQFMGDKVVKGEFKDRKYPTLVGSSSVNPGNQQTTKDANFGFSPQQVAFFEEKKIPLVKARAITNMYADEEPITSVGVKVYEKAVANA